MTLKKLIQQFIFKKKFISEEHVWAKRTTFWDHCSRKYISRNIFIFVPVRQFLLILDSLEPEGNGPNFRFTLVIFDKTKIILGHVTLKKVLIQQFKL